MRCSSMVSFHPFSRLPPAHPNTSSARVTGLASLHTCNASNLPLPSHTLCFLPLPCSQFNLGWSRMRVPSPPIINTCAANLVNHLRANRHLSLQPPSSQPVSSSSSEPTHGRLHSPRPLCNKQAPPTASLHPPRSIPAFPSPPPLACLLGVTARSLGIWTLNPLTVLFSCHQTPSTASALSPSPPPLCCGGLPASSRAHFTLGCGTMRGHFLVSVCVWEVYCYGQVTRLPCLLRSAGCKG